jgi:DNA-binding transcriptional LysR family regulator
MEIQQIRYFLAAARELNFTRAAMRCNVTQPSLTRAIRILEVELGGDLFRRERNLTHLTDLGNRMLPLMQQCIDNADHAMRLARAVRSSAVVSLHLGLRDGIPLEPFVPHLTELASAFPEFDFRIERGPAAELEARLKAGNLEMLLGPMPQDDWDRFEHWRLYRCDFGLVFRADHPLARWAQITAESLQGCCLLHRSDCNVAASLKNHLDQVGVRLKPALEFARDDDLIAYLASSRSVAILPNATHLRAPLVRRSPVGPDFGFDMLATTVSGRQRGPALNLFLTQLRAADWRSTAA